MDVNGTLLEVREVHCRDSQGSELEPILFLLRMNDQSAACNCHPFSYEKALLVPHSDEAIVGNTLSIELENISVQFANI